MKPTALSADELARRKEISRRVKAARELRCISQDALGRAAQADGLKRYDLAQIERGEREMQRIHREALIRHLKIPERWITAETVDEAIGYRDPDEERRTIENAAAEVRELLARLDALDIRREVHRAFEDYASRLGARIGKLPPLSERDPDRRPEEPPAAA